MKEIILQLFQRDLEKLKTEISSYKNEKKIWEISGETRLTGGQVKNSAGNLCLHICGNLQHFIGGVLGASGYIRNREAEFSRKNVPLIEIINEIEETSRVVKHTLETLSEDKLIVTYPINVFGDEMTTGFFLTHLTTHLNYHLGQINYHRRLLDD
jgi:uncharacterized damage-inducible protein DinB